MPVWAETWVCRDHADIAGTQFLSYIKFLNDSVFSFLVDLILNNTYRLEVLAVV